MFRYSRLSTGLGSSVHFYTTSGKYHVNMPHKMNNMKYENFISEPRQVK